ncbi:MAG: ABC transporter permease [Bacilli bacterium]|nr:ABC transporter permease [Bacilli bacterium]
MFVYFKHIFNSIKRKPTQPIIIIVTIAIAVAIFLATLAVKDVFASFAVIKYKASAGDTDISINVSSQSEVRFMEITKAEELLDEGDKAYGIYTVTSIYDDGVKNHTANIYATDLNKINEFNSFELESFAGLGQSQINNKIIISEEFASKHNLELNDEIYLKVFDFDKRYEVAGIAKNTGLFFNHDVLAHDEAIIDSIWRGLGLGFVNTPIYNKILVKLADKSTLEEKINIFKASDYFSDKEIILSDRGSDTLLLDAQGKLLLIIALLVGLLSIVIIYSSVVLLMGNRIDSVAIFKSVGATKNQMNLLLLLELLVYAIIGNIIGLLLSGVFLDILTKILNIEGLSLETLPIYYVYSFGFGVLLIISSGIFQIVGTTKKSLTELLVGINKNYSLINIKVLAMLVVIFISSYVMMFFIPTEYIIYYNLYLFILTCILIIYLLPYVVRLIYKIIEKIFTDNKKQGLIKIVSRSNNRNKSILNTNRLFIFSLILATLISTFVGIVKYEINRLENAYVGDLHIQNIADPLDTTYNTVLNTDGISSANKYLFVTNCLLFGEDNLDLIALNPQEISEILNVSEFKLQTLDFSNDEILLPEGLIIRNNLKIGDSVVINIGRNEVNFILKGSLDSPLMYFIADINYVDLGYNGLSLKLDEEKAEIAYENLILEFNNKPYIFLESRDISDYFIDMLTSFIRLFNAFLILVILIVLVGLINNLVIALQERRSEFKILWQNGLSKMQFLKLISLESSINSFGVIILGVIFSSLLVRLIILITKPMGIFFTIKEDISIYLIIFIGGLFIYLVVNFLIAYFYDIKSKNKEIY